MDLYDSQSFSFDREVKSSQVKSSRFKSKSNAFGPGVYLNLWNRKTFDSGFRGNSSGFNDQSPGRYMNCSAPMIMRSSIPRSIRFLKRTHFLLISYSHTMSGVQCCAKHRPVRESERNQNPSENRNEIKTARPTCCSEPSHPQEYSNYQMSHDSLFLKRI